MATLHATRSPTTSARVVIPRWRLPAQQVALLREALDELRAQSGVRPEKLVSAHLEG